MKLLKLFSLFIAITLITPYLILHTNAATIDGNVIIRDNKSINGQIDMNTPLDGMVVITSDPTAINGQISTEEPIISSSKRRVKRFPIKERTNISIRFETQKNNYYCGPAACVMALSGIGYKVTQEQMAALLGTTTNGTPAGNNVANALNKVVKGSRFEFRWEWHDYRKIDTIRHNLLHALSYGNPIVLNTKEGPGDNYIGGHNTGESLYHFGVIHGHEKYGDFMYYSDPGYGLFPGFIKTQKVKIKDVSYATGERGYAW